MIQKIDYNELRKAVKRANQRILEIERRYGKEKWAVKRLSDYLSADVVRGFTEAGRIRIGKKMTEQQLIYINRAVNIFLSSSESSLRGIKKKIASIKKGIAKELDISDEDAEILYQTFESDLVNWIYRYVEPSTFWHMIQEAKEDNWTKETFVDELLSVIQIMNDDDLKLKLEQIYNKYVSE